MSRQKGFHQTEETKRKLSEAHKGKGEIARINLPPPYLGEKRKAMEIGKEGRNYFVWHECPVCGEPRWSIISHSTPNKRPAHLRYCHSCANRGNRNPNWSGGRFKNSAGYIEIIVQKDDFFYPMSIMHKKNNGYILEHRLIMAKHLNRCLQPWEQVHHKNGIKDDNRFENLDLIGIEKHRQLTQLVIKINKLELENKVLKDKLKENGILWENSHFVLAVSN